MFLPSPQQGDWYNWGIYDGNDNNIDNFKRAFRHVVEVLRSTGINAKYQLAYNNKSPWGHTGDNFMSMYPGGDVCDMICVSAYSMFKIGRNTDSSPKSFKEILSDWYNQMAGTGKDLCISETNGSKYIWDKAAYIRDTWRSMAEDFPRLTMISWFMENKNAGGQDEGFDLNSEAEIRAFRDGLNDFRDRTGNARDEAPPAYDATQAELLMSIERERLIYERELAERGLTVTAHDARQDE